MESRRKTAEKPKLENELHAVGAAASAWSGRANIPTKVPSNFYLNETCQKLFPLDSPQRSCNGNLKGNPKSDGTPDMRRLENFSPAHSPEYQERIKLGLDTLIWDGTQWRRSNLDGDVVSQQFIYEALRSNVSLKKGSKEASAAAGAAKLYAAATPQGSFITKLARAPPCSFTKTL